MDHPSPDSRMMLMLMLFAVDMPVTRQCGNFTVFLLPDVHSSFLSNMASRETDKSLLLSAMLESKDEVAMMGLFFLITLIFI